jgi:tetratricopeptide (TPR) repeat protein
MKTKLFILFISLLYLVNANPIVIEAEKAYDNKNYKLAIEKYEQLINEGFKSSELYYNTGNSYFRNKNLGKAIYYYELARKIKPNDEDIRINLGIANSQTIDKIETKENFFINAVKTNVLQSISTTSWAWLTILFITLSFLIYFLFYYFNSTSLKRISFLIASFFLILFFITYFLGYAALNSKIENKFAIILSTQVNVTNEPNTVATNKFTLHEGTKVKVVESNGDWVLIKLENGNEGWLKLKDVGII